MLRWRRTRNVFIISGTISGLIVIGDSRAQRLGLGVKFYGSKASTFGSSWLRLRASASFVDIPVAAASQRGPRRKPDHSSLALHDSSPKEEEKERKAT